MSEHKCRCAGCTKSAKQATERERERIIELLEEQTSALSIGYPEWSIAEIIALIKGEN